MSLSDANPTKNPSLSQIGGADLAPIFANRFYVLVGPATTRTAFGEFITGDPSSDTNFHSAHVMPTENAVQLAKLILELHQRTFATSQADAGDASK